MNLHSLNTFNGGRLIAGRRPIRNEEILGENRIGGYYSSNPITYGIELQFLVPVLLSDRRDPHPSDPREATVVDSVVDSESAVTRDILHILRGLAEVPTTTHLGPPYPTREAFDKLDQESQAVSGRAEYSQWIVTIDNSLIPYQDPFHTDYIWVGVKVKSNKRNLSQAGHFDQIGKAIGVLRANLRIRVPSTTSLSIHVGETGRDEQTWDSGPVFFRTFCTMWWFLERYVMQLAHPSRLTNEACLPLRENSQISRNPIEELEKDEMHSVDYAHMYQKMQYIIPLLTGPEMTIIQSFWKAKNAATICQRLTVPVNKWVRMGVMQMPVPGEGKGSIGFSGFCRRALPEINVHNNGHTGTIEFRCMEGTLDPLLIINWLAVVTRLYDFSRRGNTADILGILQKSNLGLGTGQYSGLQLLEDLGLPIQAEYFRTKIETQPEKMSEELKTLFVPAK
ncbi:hypothetical protein F4805DRAFT_366417 [Annulohypoxylon moriforme]|nr:hypothetical protein F4805DRAFT_366417 [Annulohypoxylon moriforme]